MSAPSSSSSSTPLPPPPRRLVAASPSSSSSAASQTGWKARGKALGLRAMDKAIVISDWAGHKLNTAAEKVGSEHFYPVTDDFPEEMNKCARILRAFTVDGIETTIETEVKGIKRQRKVLRKIPPKVIDSACGLAIFTSMRSGFAPFGGAGGAGVVVARLTADDGTRSWSAPSAMSPNNMTAGFMIGVDIYDAVLIIRTPEALKSFASHKATLGADIGVAAGPFGAGAALEAGLEKAPVLSYVKSRGFYAGVQLVGQVFLDRFDENGKMYHWPGIKAGDILSGKVLVPREAEALQIALNDACSGRAQRMKHDALDIVIRPEVPDDLELQEGEVLKLPPTPSMSSPNSEEEEEDLRPIKKPPPNLAYFTGGDPWDREATNESERREYEQDFNARFAAASRGPPPPLPARRSVLPPPGTTSDTPVDPEEFAQIQRELNPHGSDGAADGVAFIGADEVNQSNAVTPNLPSDDFASHGLDPLPSYDAADAVDLPNEKSDYPDEKVAPAPPPLPQRSSRPASPSPAQDAVEEDEATRKEREHHEATLREEAEETERLRRKEEDEGEMTSVII